MLGNRLALNHQPTSLRARTLFLSLLVTWLGSGSPPGSRLVGYLGQSQVTGFIGCRIHSRLSLLAGYPGPDLPRNVRLAMQSQR